ncbi:MAG: hypothetical protein ACOCV4_00305, partial [Myxococcota bacterium]
MPLWLRFALFFSTMAVLLAALNVYVHRRARQAFALGRRGRRALAALLATGALSMVLGRAFTHQLGPSAAEALAVFGATIQLAVVIAAALLFLVDFPRALHHLAQKLHRKQPRQHPLGGAEGDDP